MTNLSQLAEEECPKGWTNQFGYHIDSCCWQSKREKFLAGAHAVLKCPEFKDAITALKDCDEWFQDHYSYDDDQPMTSTHQQVVQALAAFEKLAKECGE